MGKNRTTKSNMNETVELDVSRVPPPAGDESLIFDAAHAPADVWSHRSYNKWFILLRRGRLAQLGERQLDMLEVGGSKPSPPTIGFRPIRVGNNP